MTRPPTHVAPLVQVKEAFRCDIVYVTGQELGFTYLRDNTALSEEDLVSGSLPPV